MPSYGHVPPLILSLSKNAGYRGADAPRGQTWRSVPTLKKGIFCIFICHSNLGCPYLAPRTKVRCIFTTKRRRNGKIKSLHVMASPSAEGRPKNHMATRSFAALRMTGGSSGRHFAFLFLTFNLCICPPLDRRAIMYACERWHRRHVTEVLEINRLCYSQHALLHIEESGKCLKYALV